MANKKLILAIAAGAAVVAGAAVLLARKNSHKKYQAHVDEAKENFKSKLSQLQRKAKREYQNSASETESAVNSAKQRAAEWVSKASKA
jgi:gas vesicle protein